MEIIKVNKAFYDYKIEPVDDNFNVEYRVNIIPLSIMCVLLFFVSTFAITALNWNIPMPVVIVGVAFAAFPTRKWSVHADGSNLTKEEAISLIEKLGGGLVQPKG